MSNGNPTANEKLTVLWVGAQPLVWAYIRTAVQDYQHAEDVLQQTAQQTAASFDQYDASRPFNAWAIGVAKNKIREYRRRKSRDCLTFSDETLEILAESYVRQSDQLNAMRRMLAWCLAQLNEQARDLLQLRYFAGLKPGVIAEHLQLSANSVRIRLHRYRTVLMECVEERRQRTEEGP